MWAGYYVGGTRNSVQFCSCYLIEPVGNSVFTLSTNGTKTRKGTGMRTVCISPCPGSGVMWKLPHSFIQSIISRPCPRLGTVQCEYTIRSIRIDNMLPSHGCIIFYKDIQNWFSVCHCVPLNFNFYVHWLYCFRYTVQSKRNTPFLR